MHSIMIMCRLVIAEEQEWNDAVSELGSEISDSDSRQLPTVSEAVGSDDQVGSGVLSPRLSALVYVTGLTRMLLQLQALPLQLMIRPSPAWLVAAR